MNKLSAYLLEREGIQSIEIPEGFATYIISGDECYIKDIWIHKEFRKTKLASTLADRICFLAKLQGCKYITGTVCPTAKGSTDSLKVLLGYGMELQSINGQLIVFKKDI